MATVVPRWEWRVFGNDLGEAERAFAARTALSGGSRC
jgi:hypothetical protein